MSNIAEMSVQSQPDTKIAPSTTLITIGGTKYDIEVTKIPYLSSFVNFQTNSQSQGSELVHGRIPLFEAALRGIRSGYRQCFRALPADLSQHHVLCETYDFLGINVLGGQKINDIFADLKSCKTDYELEYKYYRAVKAKKSKARDAAFRLLYLILLGEFGNETKDSVKVYNAVHFVVSHSGTFKRKTRVVTRAAYEERFVVSPKQTVRLDEWVKKSSVGEEDSNDDVTTESDSFDFSDAYDSDCWD